MEHMRVTYRLTVPSGEAEARAESIAREQTVEVPRVVVRKRFIEEQVMGRVSSVVSETEARSLAIVEFPVASTARDPAQLLNVLFGNTSLHPDAECVDAEFPESLLDALSGPHFGLHGLREAIGVNERALSCTAAKPMGHTPVELAELVHSFAVAGIDVIKDDHGLANHDFCPFEARVTACLEAVERAADETGRRALYVPNLIGPPAAMAAQLDFVQERGARAFMASPMLIGLPAFHELCGRSDVPVLAHPAFGGAQRFAADFLFGSILRLYGADAVIFVGYAGRFATPREVCASLVERLRAPWGGLRPALPVPGGGVELENTDEQLDFYGPDTMLLSGGSLQLEEGRLQERARAFAARVARHGGNRPDESGGGREHPGAPGDERA
jgi:ribulose-bisphosphate carboxylase large chain